MEHTSMGRFIAALRKEQGLTQKKLAEKLSVSDKTISRWERDEGTPELALIPLIAEVFEVTSDELLKGKRLLAEPGETLPFESQRKEKQHGQVLTVGLTQYKNKSYLATGLAGCGLIAAMIGNIAFYRAYLGFLIGAIFFLGAIVFQLISANSALLVVSDGVGDDGEVGHYKRSVVLGAEKVIGLSMVLFVVTTMPLAVVDTPYKGVSAAYFWTYGLFFGMCFALVYAIGMFFFNHHLWEKGVYTLDEAAAKVYQINFALKKTHFLILLAVLAGTAFVHGAVTGFGDVSTVAKGTVFNDFDSFKVFMEEDVPAYGGNAEDSSAPTEYYDQYGNVISKDEALTQRITDGAGNVVCQFVRRNESVGSWSYGTTGGEPMLPITVLTHEQIKEARENVHNINIGFSGLYLVELLFVWVIYWQRRATPRSR